MELKRTYVVITFSMLRRNAEIGFAYVSLFEKCISRRNYLDYFDTSRTPIKRYYIIYENVLLIKLFYQNEECVK